MTQKAKGASHTVTAADVTAGTVTVHLNHLTGPTAVVVQVRTSAGVVKAHDGAVTVGDGYVSIDNSGTVDFADTDVISVIAAA